MQIFLQVKSKIKYNFVYVLKKFRGYIRFVIIMGLWIVAIVPFKEIKISILYNGTDIIL